METPQINLHKINWQRIFLIGIIVFLLCLSYVQCENNKTALATIEAQNSEISTYKLTNGQLVTSQKVATMTEKQLKEQVASKDKELKEIIKKFSDVKYVTKYVTKTKFDTFTLAYTDSIPCNFQKTDAIFTDWYSLAYKSNQHGVEVYDMVIPDSVTIVTGYKRKWFLGSKTLVVDIKHDNPFVNPEYIQQIEVKEKKKWYQTDLFKVGIGFIGGIIITR